MGLGRYGTFTGGIDLPEEKNATLAARIRPCEPPERLRVPLATGSGPPAEPCVAVGESVRASQRIATACNGGVDVFAPLGGRVAAFGWIATARGERFVESPAVELTDLRPPPETPETPERVFDWSSAEPDELARRIADGALVTHRPRPVPLARWLAGARRRRCRTLVANVVEHEPYVTADHRVLAEFGPEVIEGLAILAKAIGSAEVVLAVDRRRTGFYAGSIDAAERFGVARIALPHKYPIGADTILAKVLTRRETPPGAETTSVGTAILDAATCRAVFRWVCHGLRAIARVVTVAGARAGEARNLLVPFGADCHSLGDFGDAMVLHGGPMAGLACPAEAVVTPATAAVLALEASPRPVPTACIRCGWCTDHCPARLNVSALNDAFELSLVDDARRGGAAACVRCGVCSYVCPARLPLMYRVQQLKRWILAAASDPDSETP